jgi:anti-anti-sigma factor
MMHSGISPDPPDAILIQRSSSDPVCHGMKGEEHSLWSIRHKGRIMSTNLAISNHAVDDVLVISLVGRLDMITSQEAEAAIQAFVSEGRRKIILDAADLVYVSSAGLRILIAAKKRLIQEGGDIRLAAMRPQVRSIFAIAGFDRIFLIYGDEKTAIGSFH